MGIVAEHIAQLRGSESKAMTARAAALRSEGRSVITLSQGEPDFETPAHVRHAGRHAIDAGKTRYTAVAGVEALRTAIAAKLERDNGLRYAPDAITVGCGAKQVIFNALFASLDPGDEVVIPAPCWVSYPEMVMLAGGTPVVVSTMGDQFKLTPAALESALTSRTKWLLLNSPCNPTGAVYSSAELRALAEVLERWPNIWVLADDIYEKLVYDDACFATMASVAPSMFSRTLTVNGVSKSHAMTGWRVGYGAGPRELIRAMNLIQSQTTSHTSSVSQYAAIEALNGDDTFLVQFRNEYRSRRDLVVASMNAVPGLSATRPGGAFYVFVSCAALMGSRTPSGETITSDTGLAMYLLEEAGVAVVPGSGFLASPFFRISYASSPADVSEGCRRIAVACGHLERQA
ncbi:MAG: pyridoxal phosphate-dependent aminotransferase [bacterium]